MQPHTFLKRNTLLSLLFSCHLAPHVHLMFFKCIVNIEWAHFHELLWKLKATLKEFFRIFFSSSCFPSTRLAKDRKKERNQVHSFASGRLVLPDNTQNAFKINAFKYLKNVIDFQFPKIKVLMVPYYPVQTVCWRNSSGTMSL